MSGQVKGSILDRYSSRRFQSEKPEENQPPATPDDAELALLQSQQAESIAAARSAPPALHVISGETDEEPVDNGVYKAAFLYKARSRPRLRLHYADGLKMKVLSYAHLIEVVATSHQWLTLVFSSTIVTLKGRNLHTLVEPLQDERVRALVCYRPGMHPAPASNEPCILEIQERSIHEFAEEK